MNSLTLGALVVGGSTLLSVLGMFLVRQVVHPEKLQRCHEVGGYMLSVLGTLYAVVLGFVVVSASQDMDQARLNVEHEANAVADVFRLAEGFPEKNRVQIQTACERYVHVVIDEEWHRMQKDEPNSAGWQQVNKLWSSIRNYEPQTESQKSFYQQILSAMDEFGDCRRERLITATNKVSPVLWAVLIVGGLSTTVFTYFFALDSIRAQALMTVLVSVTLSLNIYLVALYSTPFFGDFGVKPTAFLMNVSTFDALAEERNKESTTR
ncbi:MAG TPA: hypothetical protein V6C86_13455 [Oculatellaceae cyanobacterium]